MNPFWRSQIFQRGLVQPPTRNGQNIGGHLDFERSITFEESQCSDTTPLCSSPIPVRPPGFSCPLRPVFFLMVFFWWYAKRCPQICGGRKNHHCQDELDINFLVMLVFFSPPVLFWWCFHRKTIHCMLFPGGCFFDGQGYLNRGWVWKWPLLIRLMLQKSTFCQLRHVKAVAQNMIFSIWTGLGQIFEPSKVSWC